MFPNLGARNQTREYILPAGLFSAVGSSVGSWRVWRRVIASFQSGSGVVFPQCSRRHGSLSVQRSSSNDGRWLIDRSQAAGQGGLVHGHGHQVRGLRSVLDKAVAPDHRVCRRSGEAEAAGERDRCVTSALEARHLPGDAGVGRGGREGLWRQHQYVRVEGRDVKIVEQKIFFVQVLSPGLLSPSQGRIRSSSPILILKTLN